METPICPLPEEWIKMWYLYTYKGILVIKNNKIMSLATTWMDLAIIILSEISNTETRQILYDSTLYEESKKKNYANKIICKTETDTQNLKADLWLPGMGNLGETDKLGVWHQHIHTFAYKIDNQQGATE